MDKNQFERSQAEYRAALVPHKSGMGSTAWRVTEPDTPGLFVLVYHSRTLTIPTAPETETMAFALFDGSVAEPIGSIDIDGRPGMNRWYLSNVGHEPDKEPDGEVPIEELIVGVARHLMLRHFEECLLPADTAPNK